MGAAASDIAARRQTDPASLRRLVDGDLNSITMKALEKSRDRRYSSVSDLAARYPEALGTPARVGLSTESLISVAQVSSQAQGGRPRCSRGNRIPLFEWSDGMVAFASRFGVQTQADRQRTPLSSRISKQDGRSGIRRHAAPGTVGRASTIALSHPHFRPENPADAASDETAQRGAADFGDRAADL
jgi:hypothetical protein